MSGTLQTFVPLRLRRGDLQKVEVNAAASHDPTFLEALGRAFYWQHLLDTGMMPSGSAIARAEGLHQSVVNELLRLTLLAPDLNAQWLDGRQPPRLTLLWFQRRPLPVDWAAQRTVFARFE